MAVFNITPLGDHSYDKVMEYIVSRSLTFSKDTSFGPINLEVHGNSNDYTHFKQMIESGVIHAHLQEML